MAFPRAPGQPDYTATGAGFIPEIWSGMAVQKFYTFTVLAAIASTDYDGEISAYGDKVHIRTTPDTDIFDYIPGKGITYQKPYSPPTELLIDKAKGFAFEANDILRKQSDRKLMEEWGEDAGQRMKIAIDRDVLQNIYPDAAPSNSGANAGVHSKSVNLGTTGAPVQITKTNVIETIVNLGLVMDEGDMPEMGRWLCIPAWMSALIKNSDLKDASLSGDNTSIMRNGRIGMIDRFEIYQTNQLATVDDGGNMTTNILAGHKAGLTFASQFTNTETLPNQNDFGSLVRGLNVYGYKVIEPKYLFRLYAYK